MDMMLEGTWGFPFTYLLTCCCRVKSKVDWTSYY
jgi:ferredoxin